MKTTSQRLLQGSSRKPRTGTAGYAILARMADKSRAVIPGTAGDFHFDCPLDNYLFGLKGVKGAEVKPLLEAGAENEAIAAWMDALGDPKTEAEKQAWSDSVEAALPYDNEEKKEWFIGVCQKAGIAPATSTLFDYLEADDKLIGKA